MFFCGFSNVVRNGLRGFFYINARTVDAGFGYADVDKLNCPQNILTDLQS